MVVAVKNLRKWYKREAQKRKLLLFIFSVFAVVTFVLLTVFKPSFDKLLVSLIIPTIYSLIDVLLAHEWKRLSALCAYIGTMTGGIVAWAIAY